MKIWILMLSLLAATCMWHWGPHRRVTGRGGKRRMAQIGQSLIAGIAVYFSIMSVAMLYMMLAHA